MGVLCFKLGQCLHDSLRILHLRNLPLLLLRSHLREGLFHSLHVLSLQCIGLRISRTHCGLLRNILQILQLALHSGHIQQFFSLLLLNRTIRFLDLVHLIHEVA